MVTYEVASDIASICLEIGGNFMPIPNQASADGGYMVGIADQTDSALDGRDLGDFYTTFQVNADNVRLHWSDCARLRGGELAPLDKYLHLFERGYYEIYRDGGNFLFIRGDNE